ncbi:accessory factor associated with RNA polymerase II [Yamadazyma tenuis]|uniref:CDC73-domain-containing protein n=1 Tax=Candida tenuis (strain ATCC 10573 / BCRC 21748 / CBS 615 / JCM 9827 / NBRC 10315 / NRRL Y-1498 / VKM Y-70) TaxID=590646 RepID=G3B7G5_CANTC|nr:CDC73-domain-containing protein [Yamadazyma tenuis ATCC 10573]XP_006689006.1 uncharacterized protein CANTEDRAFT_115729 [Yamadazyma tenuis ATCC 10573]EGV62835.1 CDC73-domain-containing protein [Yamadazyma tenuis ATCC 10573]EGV62836.1 hypothetical protein CANTEDRAFT_115729 [Yamadazyma tenuis ATCC 10573]WEJ93528.1 accessory factor associated with RNA polymerase II [Yamadazyma tenuis]
MFKLQTLRSAIVAKKPIELLKADGTSILLESGNINQAVSLKIGDNVYDINSDTNFFNQVESDKQSLKAVVFCWIHDKSSIVDYKNECAKQSIPEFKFLVKTDLSTWLSGTSDTCKFVDDSTSEAAAPDSGVTSEEGATREKRKLEEEDPQMARISGFEINSIDHNVILRGSKNLEFNYLLKDAKLFINQLKKNKSSSSHSKNTSRHLKSPIILLSPSTSALLSLSNIKAFLEEARFIDPTTNSLPKPANGITVIERKSDKLHPAAHKITVVDNVDFFTKPEYWDRVVGIFTTGQSWQFNKYKYSNPDVLFQKYPGFYMCYQSDVVPKQIKDWNIRQVRVDRDKRFRDKMIVNDFWNDLERILVQRGYDV